MSPVAGGLSPLALAKILIGLRFRSWRGSLRAGPRVAAARIGLGFAVVVPAAYVGLFASAIAQMGAVAGRAGEEVLLALVVGLILLASLAGKIAAGDLVVGRGGEIELLLARPLSLATLVVARGLAGVCTDLFGALFLLPVLIAAAVVWQLPVWALPLAALTSIALQITLAAAAQAGQITLVRLVPPPRRRLVFVLAALLAAAPMAAIWMVGSTVLRAPEAMAHALRPWRDLLLAGPGGLVSAPLRQLAEGGLAPALAGVVALLALAGVSLLGAALVARWAAGAGWEQADASWAEARRPPGGAAAVAELGLAGKDWRLLVRDRSRLVTLLALPLLFVGVQIFGSAGWAWSTASPTRLGVCAYSLAAYAATFGPLVHLEAERRAFWILRSVPVSLTRLFLAKAGFWAAVLGGFSSATYLVLAALAGFPFDTDTVLMGLLATGGAVLVAFLAVGLGASEADLSDDQRPALGLGTAYLFMIVSGLYNLVLLTTGAERLQALGLYLLATAAAFVVGAERVRLAFDADELRRRRLSPVVGAIGLTLLFLGDRSALLMQPVAGPEAAMMGAAVWLALVAALAVTHALRAQPRPAALDRAALLLVLALALGAGLFGFFPPRGPGQAFAALGLAIAAAAGVQELLARGIVQRGLAPADSAAARRWTGVALGAALILLGGVQRPPLLALAVALLPGLAAICVRRAPLAAALCVRFAIELGPALL